MKKMIPIYILQLAMLGTFIFVSIRALQEIQALRAELSGIRNEQLKQPTGGRPRRSNAIPVFVENDLNVYINR